jgi:DNA-binding response OmpR family regulator
MRLLLVEDDENKRAQLEHFISASWPRSELDVEISLQSGLRAVQQNKYSVVILDMTLPNYDLGIDESGGIIHPLGGKEFLRKMRRLHVDTPVVVVTQFETFGKGVERLDLDSLMTSLKNDYGNLCIGTVYYNSAIDSWKGQLALLVNSVIEARGRE